MSMTKLKAVLIVALFAIGGYARNITVSAKGSGDYKTISQALNEADAKDTIFVKKGIYNENITLVMGVVLKGENPLTTIIDGGRRGPTVNGTTGSEISNFTIRNGLEGILCENAAPYIHHNWIIDNHATGLAAFISLPHVRNNVIYGNRWSGLLAWGAKSLKNKVEHNVITRNGFSGITLKGPTNIIVQNNILLDNHFYGIYADPAAGQSKVGYNDIFNNYYPYNKFIKVDRTNLAVDPKFVNPSLSKPNLYISSRSPLVKRGKRKKNIGLLERDERINEDGDADKDGLSDSEDACPTKPEDIDDFEDEDGCPDLDNDGDGVEDALDKCEDEKEDKDGFEDKDGCPDLDNDGDKIYDVKDKCPLEAETINGFKDEDGCPDKKPEPPKKTFVLEGINFKSGSAEITLDSRVALMGVLDQIEAFPETEFKIIGHTDSRGSKSKNKSLSGKRAQSVKAWLVERGIAPERLQTEGKGELAPIASNKTAKGRKTNRRIEFQRIK